MKLHSVALLLALLPATPLLGCGTSAPSETASALDPAFQELPGTFSPESAWRHLRALAEIGPRVSGTLGAAEARGYIERALAAAGAQLIALPGASRPAAPDPEAGAAPEPVAPPGAEAAPEAGDAAAPEGAAPAVEAPTPDPGGEAPAPESAPAAVPAPAPPAAPEPVNLLAEIPGESEGVLLLMAPYDTRAIEGVRFVGVNDGASGAALLLELARVLAAKPLPYTTWLLFLDGEAAGADGESALRGSRSFAAQAKASGALSRIRLALYTNRVCDADLLIARDLLSHRLTRDSFWDAALRLGYSDHFERDAFQSPKGGHLALRSAGLAPIAALQDTSFGGSEPPGAYANTDQDDLAHCAPESLEVVGRVVLEGLDAISARLQKIDRFARSPMSVFREEWQSAQGERPVAAPADPPLPAAGAQARE